MINSGAMIPPDMLDEYYLLLSTPAILCLLCWLFCAYRRKKNLKYYEEHKDEFEDTEK